VRARGGWRPWRAAGRRPRARAMALRSACRAGEARGPAARAAPGTAPSPKRPGGAAGHSSSPAARGASQARQGAYSPAGPPQRTHSAEVTPQTPHRQACSPPAASAPHRQQRRPSPAQAAQTLAPAPAMGRPQATQSPQRWPAEQEGQRRAWGKGQAGVTFPSLQSRRAGTLGRSLHLSAEDARPCTRRTTPHLRPPARSRPH
jgi:hypothetical protein